MQEYQAQQFGNAILNIVTKSDFSQSLSADELDKQIKENLADLNNPISKSQIEDFLGFYKIEGTDIKLKYYQQKAVDKTNEIFENKKFASVILPTGAGKSFVALAELLQYKDEKMLYLAPSDEILNQIKKYTVKYVHGTADTLGKTDDEILKEVFPNLTLATYQSLLHKSQEQLKQNKYNFIVLDELHRTGAKEWGEKLDILLENQSEDVRALGLTATPERDSDGKNMADEIALKLGYTKQEVENRQHVAMKMDLVDAIRLGIVVNPKIVSCEYNILHDGQLDQLVEKIKSIEDEEKRKELLSKYEKLRRNLENAQEIPELFRSSITKKDGRYIVFLPVGDKNEILEDEEGNSLSKKSSEDKLKEYIPQLKEWLGLVDEEPEIYSMLGQYSNKKNADQLNQFETSQSNHIKLMVVMNKLNEGVHVDGVDGIIWQRPLDENSKILLLQQLGRAIYAVDENNPIKDEDRPIVIDLPNNMMKVDLEKTINTYSTRDDIDLLRDVIDWIDSHNGNLPDIDSKSNEESRIAITLKRIQSKYEKYLNNEQLLQELDESKLEKIEEILQVGSQIDLWDLQLPDKRRKDEKEEDIDNLANINFSVKGTLKDLYELEKEAEEISVPVFLKNARAIKEWMEENETTKPPSSKSKNEEEKKLGRALGHIRQRTHKTI